jgi:hypothetical protein
MNKGRPAVGLFFIFVALSYLLGCKQQPSAIAKSVQEKTVSINLRHLGIRHRCFKKYGKCTGFRVLQQLGAMADAGQPFNATDMGDSLPRRQLVVAGVSQQYCALSYWQGGMILEFETSIFELSNRDARLIWVSLGQGGFNLPDLKAMIESGRMHNDLAKRLQ